MKKPFGKLSKVSGKNHAVDPKKLYDNWAKEYEEELINCYGYIAHEITTNKFNAIIANKNINPKHH